MGSVHHRPTGCGVEFGVLGPLVVSQGDRLVRVGGARQRSLLAVLLIRANELVSSDQLIEELWGERPPYEAANALQAAVSRLRRSLGAGHANGGPGGRIVTRSPGYVFEVDPELIDARRFERLARAGRDALAQGGAVSAAAHLADALALWRGEPFADFVYEPFAQSEIARLEELRLVATEDRIEAALHLGRELDVVSELESLVARHPFRERLRGGLMLALYRTGRQAEALEAYREGHRTMTAELGIDPSPALRELEAAILRQDSSLSAPWSNAGSLAVQSSAAAPSTRPEPVAVPGRRKPATVVFAELVVRATAASRRDLERVEEVQRRYRAIAADCFDRHGGSVERDEDAVTVAVFGLPFLHEDDALRALRAASEVNAEMSGVAAELGAGAGLEVGVRIGISTGEVVAGDASSGRPVAIEPVRGAAHLVEMAAAGEILIDDATYPMVAAAVQVERRPPGGREGKAAFASVRRVTEVAPLVATRPQRGAAMVGRELELAQLVQAFEWSVRGRMAYLTTVLGAAGIGKTRLALGFAQGLGEEATVLTGRCLPYGEGITYWPLREILVDAFGDDLEQGVEDLLAGDPDADLMASQLAGAAGLADTDVAVEEVRWAARRVLEALARDRPIVLVLDDLHWAEPTFLDLVQYLLELSSQAPMLLLCLARPELLDERPGWAGGQPNSSSLLLDALPDDDARALLRMLADEARLDAADEQRVLAAAEGNPFFLEQIVATLAEGRPDTEAFPLPATIQALLATRLERLGPGERAVLERAAVIGKDFKQGAVAALLPREARPPLARHLEQLARKRFIRSAPASASGDAGYRFDHVLVQEAAYRAIPTPLRAELHECFANWLERPAVEGRVDAAEIVAYHLEQAYRYRVELGNGHAAAELAERAAKALTAAGRAAWARGDMPATANLLGRATALLPPAHVERRQILPDLAKARMEIGDLESAENLLEEAMRIGERTGDRRLSGRATVARELQHARSQRTPMADSYRIVERVIPTLEQADDAAGLADAWLYLSYLDISRGRSGQARAEAQRAAAYARQAGDRWREAAVIDQVAFTCMTSEPVSEALHQLAALRHSAAVERGGRVRVDLSFALGLAFQGRSSEARELCRSARTALEEMGMPRQALQSVVDRAEVELLAGDAHAAEEELRPALERLVLTGEHAVASYVAALLAEALGQQGKNSEAESAAATATDLGADDDLSTQILARTALAGVRAHQGRLVEAERLAREAVDISLRTDWADWQADAFARLAEVLQADGRERDAELALRRALDRYEHRENIVGARRARSALATLAARPAPAVDES
jgi:DNA-binding SARP family transcriptional activator/class 3 adenylate cyclase